MLFLLTLTLALVVIFPDASSSEIINVNCDYKSGNFGDYYAIPFCDIRGNVKIHRNDSIIEISNPVQHVKAVQISQKETFLIPKGIDRFYPNLQVLIIVLSKLKKVFVEDFKAFPDLEYLNLNFNQIEILEENLFKFNRKLRFIFLNDNKIKLIDPNLFKSLPNLEQLSLESNLKFNATVIGKPSIKVYIQETIVDQFWNAITEITKFKFLDIDIEMTNDKVYLLNNFKQKFEDRFSVKDSIKESENETIPWITQNDDELNLLHRNFIFMLISMSLLIYSFNFLILCCLYPSK